LGPLPRQRPPRVVQRPRPLQPHRQAAVLQQLPHDERVLMVVLHQEHQRQGGLISTDHSGTATLSRQRRTAVVPSPVDGQCPHHGPAHANQQAHPVTIWTQHKGSSYPFVLPREGLASGTQVPSSKPPSGSASPSRRWPNSSTPAAAATPPRTCATAPKPRSPKSRRRSPTSPPSGPRCNRSSARAAPAGPP